MSPNERLNYQFIKRTIKHIKSYILYTQRYLNEKVQQLCLDLIKKVSGYNNRKG